MIFEEAATRENIASGDKLSVVLGKIKKWYSDLKKVAFTGKFEDLVEKPGVVTKTENGLVQKEMDRLIKSGKQMQMVIQHGEMMKTHKPLHL